jgi:hypothetical protein
MKQRYPCKCETDGRSERGEDPEGLKDGMVTEGLAETDGIIAKTATS